MGGREGRKQNILVQYRAVLYSIQFARSLSGMGHQDLLVYWGQISPEALKTSVTYFAAKTSPRVGQDPRGPPTKHMTGVCPDHTEGSKAGL